MVSWHPHELLCVQQAFQRRLVQLCWGADVRMNTPQSSNPNLGRCVQRTFAARFGQQGALPEGRRVQVERERPAD